MCAVSQEIAEELGFLSSDSSEEEVLTTRVVRRRVIIQVNKHDAAVQPQWSDAGLVGSRGLVLLGVFFHAGPDFPGYSEHPTLITFPWLILSSSGVFLHTHLLKICSCLSLFCYRNYKDLVLKN